MSLQGPEQLALLVVLRRREARRVHRVQLETFRGERLARGAEVDQHRGDVVADVDVRRLDVEVQQLVRVHFPEAVEEQGEHAADEVLLHRPAAGLDVLLQGAAALVAHHEVHRLVRAEEVQHSHHVRVRELRERAPLLEEALHAVAERREVLVGDRGQHVALATQRERAWQILLDGDRLVAVVVREVDDREAARRQHFRDAIGLELVALGQRQVGLRRHVPGETVSLC